MPHARSAGQRAFSGPAPVTQRHAVGGHREPGQVVGLAGGVTSSQAAASAAFRAARRRFATYRSGRTEFSSNASSGPASAQDVVAGCVTDGRVLAAAHAWWPDEVAGASL